MIKPLYRYALHKYSQYFSSAGIPFPGSTHVYDAVSELLHNTQLKHPHILQWEQSRRTAWLRKCIRSKARRDCNISVAKHHLYQAAISSLHFTDSTPSFEQAVDSKLELERILSAISKLPIQQQELLAFALSHSIQQYALDHRITPNAAYKQLAKTRLRLIFQNF